MKDWKNLIARFYICAAFILIPLYYENGYFNTLAAKYHIYMSCVGVALAFGLIIWIIEKCVVRPVTFAPVAYVKNFNLMDIAVAAFGIVALLSAIFSQQGTAAFTGENGWHMGALTLITLCLMYFYISRNYEHTKNIWLPLVGVADILYLLGFLNGLDIDPLGLHALLSDKEHFEYIATIGNVNSYAGYLSLTIPVLAMLYIGNKRKWFKYFAGASLILAYTNMYMANSDGAFLGVGFGFLFLIYYCLKDVNRWRGLLWNGLFFCFASAICKVAQVTHGDDIIEFLGVPATLLKYNLYIPIGLVCYILILWIKQMEHHVTPKQCKIMSRAFMVAAIAAVAIMVGYNAMHFSGKWGSKRGWIWMFSMQLFDLGSIKDKLIGVGPDCFAQPMMNNFGDFIEEKWGKRVANAHNEYIQYLITMGITGAISYLGLYLASFRNYLKREDWFEEKAALFFGIMGYAGQAVVNNPQAMNYAIFFIFLAMFRGMKPEPEKVGPVGKKAKEAAKKKGKRY